MDRLLRGQQKWQEKKKQSKEDTGTEFILAMEFISLICTKQRPMVIAHSLEQKRRHITQVSVIQKNEDK